MTDEEIDKRKAEQIYPVYDARWQLLIDDGVCLEFEPFTYKKFSDGTYYCWPGDDPVGWRPAVNLSDTFAYSCADAEEIPDEYLDLLIEINNKYSHHGVTALCAILRKTEPITPRKTKEYYEAKEYLDSRIGVLIRPEPGDDA